ncbi:MAG: T9SS type A sorting domain-containing protein [Bacteroidetes bacterium]|nr:T9SS type A sorting domain-containing protein [Bacteroidota bacterium]
MKKFILITLLAFGINAKAQITLEHTYDSASTYGVMNTSTTTSRSSQLMIINFEVSGEKYVKINRTGKVIDIYDMNHSLVKTISFASFPQTCNGVPTILYLSEKLFDIDSQLEFMYLYNDCAGAVTTKIYKEDGTCIFTEDSMAAWIMVNVQLQQYPIYNTSQGTKMILSHQNAYNGDANVYGLPGTLSMGIQEGNNLLLAQSSISNAYPNPSINSTRIDYTFPNGVSQGEIIFYDLQGKEIKRYKVDKTFDHLLISTADIPAGTYFFQLQTSDQASEGRKMVVIK